MNPNSTTLLRLTATQTQCKFGTNRYLEQSILLGAKRVRLRSMLDVREIEAPYVVRRKKNHFLS